MPENNPAISIPDALFDAHFGGANEEPDTVEEQEDPATDDQPPADDDPDTDDESPGDDEGDTSEEDDGEGEDAEGEEDGAGGDPDDEESPFDRREIDAITDPEAKRVAEKAYKSLVRTFTQKTQELAEERRGIQQDRTQLGELREFHTAYTHWLEGLGTPEGGEAFLLSIMDQSPDAFTPTVLADLAMRDPEAFAAALDEAQAISDDPRAKKVFDGERKQKLREASSAQQKRGEQARRTAEAHARLEKLVVDTAGESGIRKSESLELVYDSVDGFIRRAQAAGRKVTADDVKKHVASVASRMAAEKKDAARATERKAREEAAAKVKKQATQAKQKRPVPAATSGTLKGKDSIPDGTPRHSRVGAIVDHYFG